jgi:hypothetical protein
METKGAVRTQPYHSSVTLAMAAPRHLPACHGIGWYVGMHTIPKFLSNTNRQKVKVFIWCVEDEKGIVRVR